MKPPKLVLSRLKQEGYKTSGWFNVPDPEGTRWFGYLTRKENGQEKYYAVTISSVTCTWIVEILASYHVFKITDPSVP